MYWGVPSCFLTEVDARWSADLLSNSRRLAGVAPPSALRQRSRGTGRHVARRPQMTPERMAQATAWASLRTFRWSMMPDKICSTAPSEQDILAAISA